MQNDSQLIGENGEFLNLLDLVSLWAGIARPVLIQGERGVGKELIAARLHYLSPRWKKPYVTLNCAAIAETLMESELFGAEAGAFTGAIKSRAGRLERADGGTLFLDEIASMPQMMQEKLLRFLEYGEVERLGGHRTMTLDVRIVAASNVDLQSLAQSGKFRPDLLDRLAFDVLSVPPLRVRGDDILLLAEHFAKGVVKEKGWLAFSGMADEAKISLLRYSWPGNVRELKNVVERTVFQHLDEEDPIRTFVFDPFDSPHRPPSELSVDVPSAPHLPVLAAEESDQRTTMGNLHAEIAALEKMRIEQALQSSAYHLRSAASLLGLSYHQLRHLLKKHEIPLKRPKSFPDVKSE